MTKAEHLDRTRTPKRILSLDGGGIRGVLTLEFLDRIEALLRARTGRPALRLCDYFDLIGGTSTGSIIAAALACGFSVADLKTLYRAIGGTVFQASFLRRGLLAPKFPSAPVRQALADHIGADTTLDSDRILTGLMVMTKRLDTGAPWPLHNHPDGRYAAQNGPLRLADIVRASTAAPTYFEPERLSISARDGRVVEAAFVDGGVSPFNDPSLQLLMLATLHGHGFRWPTGRDRLLLVSVGTGSFKQTFTTDALMSMLAAEQGLRALQSLMDDCGRTNQTMVQWLTRSLTPWTLDRAVGDMRLDSEAGPQLATSVRYDALLTPDWLAGLGLAWPPDHVARVAAMDDPANMDDLATIGQAAAAAQVQAHHFPEPFDLAQP